MSFLIDWLVHALQWAFNTMLLLPLHCWVLFLGGLQAAVNAIPVPNFISAAQGYIANMPPWVLYLAQGLQIGYGIHIVITAWLFRWILRRIPLIG